MKLVAIDIRICQLNYNYLPFHYLTFFNLFLRYYYIIIMASSCCLCKVRINSNKRKRKIGANYIYPLFKIFCTGIGKCCEQFTMDDLVCDKCHVKVSSIFCFYFILFDRYSKQSPRAENLVLNNFYTYRYCMLTEKK